MTFHEDAPVPAVLLPVAVKVIVYGGNLYTETGFPLYRYVPLADMLNLTRLKSRDSHFADHCPNKQV